MGRHKSNELQFKKKGVSTNRVPMALQWTLGDLNIDMMHKIDTNQNITN